MSKRTNPSGTEEQTVKACPSCDQTNITNTPAKRHKWRCDNCYFRFDVPEERPVRDKGQIKPTNGLAAKLADPDVTSLDDLRGDSNEP